MHVHCPLLQFAFAPQGEGLHGSSKEGSFAKRFNLKGTLKASINIKKRIKCLTRNCNLNAACEWISRCSSRTETISIMIRNYTFSRITT
jgi:hypothetical protein